MFFVHCSLNFWSTAHRDVLFTAITVQQFNGWKSLPRRHQLLCNSSNFTFYPSSCSVSLFLCIWHNRLFCTLSLSLFCFSLCPSILQKKPLNVVLLKFKSPKLWTLRWDPDRKKAPLWVHLAHYSMKCVISAPENWFQTGFLKVL